MSGAIEDVQVLGAASSFSKSLISWALHSRTDHRVPRIMISSLPSSRVLENCHQFARILRVGCSQEGSEFSGSRYHVDCFQCTFNPPIRLYIQHLKTILKPIGSRKIVDYGGELLYTRSNRRSDADITIRTLSAHLMLTFS